MTACSRPTAPAIVSRSDSVHTARPASRLARQLLRAGAAEQRGPGEDEHAGRGGRDRPRVKTQREQDGGDRQRQPDPERPAGTARCSPGRRRGRTSCGTSAQTNSTTPPTTPRREQREQQRREVEVGHPVTASPRPLRIICGR
jgi:hypothetical protein